jgi:hypothetical protein
MPDATDSRPRPRPPWRAWVWPPALATAAVVLQLLIDVPRSPMLDDEPEPKPAPETKATTAAHRSRPWKPRKAEYVERLRKSWSTRAIADEPIERRFAWHHEKLLHAVARKAEATAIPGEAPMTVTTRARCHTIRCEFELCAPIDDAEAIFEVVPRFAIGKRSLWHELREVDSERESDDEVGCRRWIVDFAVEGADPRRLRVPRASKPSQPRPR